MKTNSKTKFKVYDISAFKTELSELRRLHYNVITRENIITIMVNKGLAGTDNYLNYWEEYMQYYIQYERYKRNVISGYVLPKIGVLNGTWDINFDKEEVRVYEEV